MRLIRRKPKKLEACGKLELEKVIGLTTTTANGLACNGVSEELAYLAGCVIVVYNARTNCQTRFLTAPRSSKAFACVAFSSQGGKFLAAGESGHQPAIIVWEVTTGLCIADMKSHKYGVSSVDFSPNGKHLVSLGVLHDGYMCLWDWKSGAMLMKTRAAATSLSASALHFASDGSFFVSGGTKHLKHWSIPGPRARTSGMNANPGMDGRPIKLGSQKDSSFVCVASAAVSKEQAAGAPAYQPLYALTSSGVLCLLHSGLAIEKWVDLQVRQAYALAVSEAHVACACSDGIVRIFMQDSLLYTATLPRPAPYGYHGLTDANVGAYLAVGHRVTSGIKFPNAVACSFLQQGQKLAVVYSDHSLYVWDVRSYSKIGRSRTFLSHSSCIWDLAIIPELLQVTSETNTLPGGAFATCSADGTIRLWHLDFGQEGPVQESSISALSSSDRPSNVYSKDVLGVLYIVADSLGEQKGRPPSVGTDDDVLDTTVGFRSICVSPDGHHLAAGDSSGNLRIYDLSTLLLHSFQEAHDAEILSLNFTTLVNGENTSPGTIPLLASGGRDRLIHIYDVNRGYDVIDTLDDHTASITTVKFACNGLKLLSCSADKSVVFRHVDVTSAGCKSTRYHQEIATRGTIYDMDTDASDKLVVTVGQEKKLNVLSLATGKPVRCFKPEGDIGEPIKVRMDPSGMYMVCSHSDRCMRIYDVITGELLAQASGHAEVITGVTFLPDCRRLISVSGDSCIFVWRLPLLLSRAIRKRCSAQAESRTPLKTLKSVGPRSVAKGSTRAAKVPRMNHQMNSGGVLDAKFKSLTLEPDENKCIITNGENTLLKSENNPGQKEVENPHAQPERGEMALEETPAAFKFSVSRLPPWAQAKIALEEANSSCHKVDAPANVNSNQSFESRWAERLGCEGYKLFSEFMEEVTPPATIRASGFGARRRFSVEGSGAVNSDNISESTSSLQGSPTPSPNETSRKETHWTTVHTVYLNDSDFDDSPKLGKLASESNRATGIYTEIFPAKSPLGVEQTGPAKSENEDADRVEVGLSDNEGERGNKRASHEEEEEIVYYTPGSAPVGVISKDGEEVLFKVSSKNKHEDLEDLQSAPTSPLKTSKKVLDNDGDNKRLSRLDSGKLSVDSEEDERAEDDEFSPRRDLFSAHFDKLASDLKVDGSARSSFSARFFAKSNAKFSRMNLFQPAALPALAQMKLNIDTKALLEEDEDEELSPVQLLLAERERLKLKDQQDKKIGELQGTQDIQSNMTITGSKTEDHGISVERCNGDTIGERQPSAIQCSGSPQTPDLLPSRSPQLTQEGTGRSCSPMPFTFSAKKKVPGSPAVHSRFQNGVANITSVRASNHSNHNEIQISGPKKVEADASCNTSNSPIDNLLSSKSPLPTARVVSHNEEVRVIDQTPTLDDFTKQESVPNRARITDTEEELKNQGVGHHAKVFVSATGLPEQGDSQEGPLQSSWESVPCTTTYRLPRPVEDYQNSLMDLLVAAKRASLLFGEVHSVCQKIKSPDPCINSGILASSTLPAGVVTLGNAYQKLLPETLELVQNLSDKASACVFPSECIEASKSPDDGTLYDFSFSKSHDFGENAHQLWPRTSAASLDSLLSSVDVESLISRYSETLASQVLALVQKSLPGPHS